MVSQGQVIGFIPTTNAARARGFYQDVLELEFLDEDPFALVFESRGTAIRVVKIDSFTPVPYTILGWEVKDIEKEVRALTARGVPFPRYPPMQQNDLRIWTAPDGTKVAWLRDPDGNVLSLTQHSESAPR